MVLVYVPRTESDLQTVSGGIQGGIHKPLYSIIGGRENFFFHKMLYVKFIIKGFYKDGRIRVLMWPGYLAGDTLLYSFSSLIPFWRNGVALKRARML